MILKIKGKKDGVWHLIDNVKDVSYSQTNFEKELFNSQSIEWFKQIFLHKLLDPGVSPNTNTKGDGSQSEPGIDPEDFARALRSMFNEWRNYADLNVFQLDKKHVPESLAGDENYYGNPMYFKTIVYRDKEDKRSDRKRIVFFDTKAFICDDKGQTIEKV